MEKKIFMALGLHLLTEFKLLLLICLVCCIQIFIMTLFLRRHFIYLSRIELMLLSCCFFSFAYSMFMVDHLTFFITIFYTNNLMYFVYYVCKKYPDKVEVETRRIAYLEKEDPIKNKDLIRKAEITRAIELAKRVNWEWEANKRKKKKWW